MRKSSGIILPLGDPSGNTLYKAELDTSQDSGRTRWGFCIFDDAEKIPEIEQYIFRSLGSVISVTNSGEKPLKVFNSRNIYSRLFYLESLAGESDTSWMNGGPSRFVRDGNMNLYLDDELDVRKYIEFISRRRSA